MSLFARATLFTGMLLFASPAVFAQYGGLPNNLARSAKKTSSVAKALTNESILSLLEAEISDDLIIRRIRGSECHFDISASAIAELKSQGVSKPVLEEMINVSTPLLAVPASERASSPIGAKFYVAPMPEGFDGFIAAELVKRKLPLTIVDDERAADFIITGATNKGVHKWYDTVFGNYERDRNQGSIKVVRVKDRTVVWAGEAGDRSFWWGALKKGGQRKVADRIVGKMTSQYIKKSL
ncbi:MAG: hypothetical protein M3447_08695 [Acidobacteriota bacterium]|nr:hypothetical protein [Acidobacteriota bacterium]